MSLRLRMLAATAFTTLIAAHAGCNAIFGVDDLVLDDVAGGEGGVSSQGGAGGAVSCIPGEVRPCYTGPEDTENEGQCSAGTETCSEDGTAFGACSGEVLPRLETCGSGEDHDCNGLECLEAAWSRTFSDDAPAMQNQTVTAVATFDDAVVVVGTYRAALRIGAFLETGDSSLNGFAARFSTDGTFKWLATFTGPDMQVPSAVAIDDTGAIYVAGTFNQGIVLPDGTAESSGDATSGFLVKLIDEDAAASMSWSHVYRGDMDVHAAALSIDEDNRIFLAGEVTGSATFGSHDLDAGANADGFLLQVDPNGDVAWSNHFGGGGTASLVSVAASDGRVFVGGTFTGALALGVDAPSRTDGLLVSLDAATGSVLDHLQIAGTVGERTVTSVGTLDGDVVVAGHYDGESDLGGTVRNADGRDSFVARLPAALDSTAWVNTLGGPADILALALTVDEIGEVTVAGWADGDVTIDGNTLDGAGSSDILVMKVDAGGVSRFATRFGDAAPERATSIASIASSRDLLVGGTFNGNIDFIVSMHTAQATDGFLLRLGR